MSTASWWLLPLLPILPVSCWPEPDLYRGNVDGLRYAIPRSAISLPARYEGEDDWTPAKKPRLQRGFSDRLSFVEILRVNDSGLKVASDPPGTGGWHYMPAVTVDFWQPKREALHTAPRFADLLRDADPAPAEWGLRKLQANRSSPRYYAGFDREYWSADGTFDATCSNERMVVSSYTKMPDSCNVWISDAPDHADINIMMQARYLPAWPQLAERMRKLVASWRVNSKD